MKPDLVLRDHTGGSGIRGSGDQTFEVQLLGHVVHRVAHVHRRGATSRLVHGPHRRLRAQESCLLVVLHRSLRRWCLQLRQIAKGGHSEAPSCPHS